MKHYAIGDIHGCYLTMKRLIVEELSFNIKEDKLILLGDYIDRGPRSCDVLTYLFTMQCFKPSNIILLKGNHEEMYLYANNPEIEDKDYILETWEINGGKKTIESFKNNSCKINEFYFRIDQLPLYYETKKYIFVHAGIYQTIQKSDNDTFLWSRNCINQTKKTIIHGHTPINKDQILLQNKKDIINIDSGCVFNTHQDLGYLTAYCPEDNKFYFQKNID